ncbi:MAG: DNA-directed RNA polymerase subunit omega [Verrucomicrobiota bacterium]
MNSEYVKQAMAKVGNPNVLVNIISRRVRQLTSGGASGRPLIEQTAGMGIADVALVELIEDKMDFEISSATEEEAQPAPKKRRRS